jgi:mRNA interferase RelE/StbE
MYTVRYSRAAAKALQRVPAKLQERIVETPGTHRGGVRVMANQPAAYRGDWKPLHGTPYWPLRIGGYRVICDLRAEELVLLVIKVGSRGDVYK